MISSDSHQTRRTEYQIEGQLSRYRSSSSRSCSSLHCRDNAGRNSMSSLTTTTLLREGRSYLHPSCTRPVLLLLHPRCIKDLDSAVVASILYYEGRGEDLESTVDEKVSPHIGFFPTSSPSASMNGATSALACMPTFSSS